MEEHCPRKDLVLSLTKEGCLSIRERMRGRIENNELKVHYRTLASLLVNGANRQFDSVFIDEALLMHAGFIGFVVALTGAKKVVLVGDEWQVPFMDRERITNNAYCSPRSFCEVSTTIACSRRCPVDVCFALSENYPGIYSSSPVCLSMKYSNLNDAAFSNEANTLYMTHTQDDKEALLTMGLGHEEGSNVLTIHEAQGLTYKHVVLVRFNNKPMQLYQSIEHAIVAVSRHTHSFKYVTTERTDMVSKLMKKVGECTEGLLTWNEQQRIRCSMGLSEDRIIRPRTLPGVMKGNE